MSINKNFENMIGKLSPTLRRITHRLNGHFTFFDEDDLYQEALEHLWLAFENGTLSDKTDSYVLQGCYFHLKNYIRKTMDRIRPVSLDSAVDDDGTTIGDLLAYEDRSIEDAAENAMLADLVKSRGLSEREKTVLSLLSDGMTVREIGSSMGISHAMVVKIRNGIKDKCALLKNMQKEGYHN